MERSNLQASRSSGCLPQQLRQYTFRALPQPKKYRIRSTGGVVRAEKEEEKAGPFGFDLAKAVGTMKMKAGAAAQSGTMRIGLGNVGGFGTLKLQRKPGGSKKAGPDPNTVFVAGSTGRLGARIVRELLAKGLSVRAGARNVEQAEQYKQVALAYGIIPPEAARKLEIVEVDLSSEESVEAAIGNAGKVVSALGASESFDVNGPKTIDGEATVRLIEVADKLKVQQFVLVTSLGTGKFGWPAGILNLFWGVLLFKRKAEEALERSSLNYCIVRPGGMERPTDDYKTTHNIKLLPRDSVFGGQVSRLQVAELVAATLVLPELAENKCLEVIAETDAPALSFEELLSDIPTEITQEDKMEVRAKLDEAKQKVEAAQQFLSEVREASAELQGNLAEIQQREQEIIDQQKETVQAGRQAEAQLEELRAAAEEASRVEAAAKAVLRAAEQAGREGRLLSGQEIEAIQFPILNPPSEEELEAQREAEERERQSRLEQQRKEAEAAAKKAEEEKKKKQAEIQAQKAAALKQAEEDKKKKEAEIAARKKAEEEERKRKDTEIAAQKKVQEEERRKKEAEIAAQKKAEEEERKQKDAEIAAQKKAEDDKKRKEAEAAALKQAEEQKRIAAEAQAQKKAKEEQKKAEEAKKKQMEEEAAVAAAKKKEEDAKQQQASSSSGVEGTNGSLPNPFKAFKVPVFNFGQQQEQQVKEVPENVREARQWIAAWRARSLEAKLPQNVSANQK